MNYGIIQQWKVLLAYSRSRNSSKDGFSTLQAAKKLPPLSSFFKGTFTVRSAPFIVFAGVDNATVVHVTLGFAGHAADLTVRLVVLTKVGTVFTRNNFVRFTFLLVKASPPLRSFFEDAFAVRSAPFIVFAGVDNAIVVQVTFGFTGRAADLTVRLVVFPKVRTMFPKYLCVFCVFSRQLLSSRLFLGCFFLVKLLFHLLFYPLRPLFQQKVFVSNLVLKEIASPLRPWSKRTFTLLDKTELV